MGIIRIMPRPRADAADGADPYEGRSDLAAVLHGADADSLAEIGSIDREGSMWKRARGRVRLGDEVVETSGIAQLVAAVRERIDPDADLEASLTVHDGYVCIYRPDGSMAARVLSVDGGQRVRIMDPHAAETVAGSPAEGVARAFEMLRTPK